LETVVIKTDLTCARSVAEEIVSRARAVGYSEDAVFGIKLALEEALVNAIKHGNRDDPTRAVTIAFDVGGRQADISVTDEGEGFCPADVPDPTADENLESPTGRGIMLMRAYMDRVTFSKRGNAVRMVRFNR